MRNVPFTRARTESLFDFFIGISHLFVFIQAFLGGYNLVLFELQVLKDVSRVDYDWSYMIAWIGVGFALISSILFSCAAICLRREREKEEAVNMQYLMPGL